MRARHLALVVALAVTCVGALASATTMRALDVDALTEQADVVVLGTVEHVGSVVVSDDGRIEPRMVTRVAVEERLAGWAPRVLSVVEPEGSLGAIEVHREGLSRMRRGQSVLLFLRRTSEGRATFRPVGHAQGAYLIRSGRDGTPPRLARAGDPGWLVGSAKARGVDLDARPSLDDVRAAVAAAGRGR